MRRAEKMNIRWQLLRSATSAAGSEILQRRVTRPYRQKTRSIDGYCRQKSSTSVETTYCDATGAAGSPRLCVERQCDGLSCTFDLMTASDVTPSAPCLNCLWHNKGKQREPNRGQTTQHPGRGVQRDSPYAMDLPPPNLLRDLDSQHRTQNRHPQIHQSKQTPKQNNRALFSHTTLNQTPRYRSFVNATPTFPW